MRPLVATGSDGDGGTPGNGRGEGRRGGAMAAAAPIAASPMASIAGQARGGPVPAAGPGGVKLGRNDPCWCGSGKKYKRCHGA
jgi:hypothetical protein